MNNGNKFSKSVKSVLVGGYWLFG